MESGNSRETSPHADVIEAWEASGLDASIVRSVRFLDTVHELDLNHLERMRALFMRTTEDDRWDGLCDWRPDPGDRLPLEEAIRAVGLEDALDIFENSDLFHLYERDAVVDSVLASRDVPFYTLGELATTLEGALRCLERNRQYLLEYGHAMTSFERCRMLSDLVSRLYYVRVPYGGSNRRAWLVDPQVLQDFFPPDNPPEPYDWVYFTDKTEGLLAAIYHEIEPLEEIAEAERTRLENSRPGLFDLKANILDLLSRGVRSQNAERLWDKCFELIANTITAEQAEFYLRIDRLYQGYDIRTGEMVDEEAGLIAGGLTAVLEVIGHCEKEIVIGPLHHCKEVLEAEGLAGLDELGRGELRTSDEKCARSYFAFVRDKKRNVLDNAIDEFLRLSADESRFWQEYVKRVNNALENELYEEVSIRKKVRRRFAHKFRPHMTGIADIVAGHLEVSGEVPRLIPPMEASGDPGGVPLTRSSSSERWSKPHGLKEWSNVFEVSVTTMRRWLRKGNITNKKVSQRRWKVAIEELPVGYEQNPDFVGPANGSAEVT